MACKCCRQPALGTLYVSSRFWCRNSSTLYLVVLASNTFFNDSHCICYGCFFGCAFETRLSLRYHAGPKRQACFPDDCKFRVPGMWFFNFSRSRPGHIASVSCFRQLKRNWLTSTGACWKRQNDWEFVYLRHPVISWQHWVEALRAGGHRQTERAECRCGNRPPLVWKFLVLWCFCRKGGSGCGVSGVCRQGQYGACKEAGFRFQAPLF